MINLVHVEDSEMSGWCMKRGERGGREGIIICNVEGGEFVIKGVYNAAVSKVCSQTGSHGLM